MMKELYKETFSQVRSSYEFNLEDFEKMKTKSKRPTRKIILIAAAVAILAAFGITASATDFFGLARFADPTSGTISAQGYVDSPETKAYMEHLNTGMTLREAAAKYGLTYVDRCEVFSYEEMKALQGGDLMDMRSSRGSFIVYEDGAFSTSPDFSCNGKTISYSLYRSVKGSLTQMELNVSWLGEAHKEWNIRIGAYEVCLVLGSGSRSFILADLGNGFLTLNVYAGREADAILSDAPVTEEELEALAKSLNWSLLSKIVVPDLPPKQEVQFGAGVELAPENIVEDQSFLVELPGWGETHFITYKPTQEFDTVRFFLSRDGKVSDYEFHAVFEEHWVATAAVCFTDLTGDGETDVLVLNDYKNDYTGQTERQVRIYSYAGNGEFKWEEERSFEVRWAIDNRQLTVDAVLNYFGSGGQGADANSYAGVLAMLSDKYKDNDLYLRYGLFDLTGDGTPELIAGYGTVEADATAGVWSMDTGTLKKLGEIGMSHAILYVDGEGRLLRLTGHMGYEFVDLLSWDGAQITEMRLSGRVVPEDEPYSKPGTPLEMAPDSDLSLLQGADIYGVYRPLITHPAVLGYALFDLNGDGNMELILDDGSEFRFWAAVDGREEYLGELSAVKTSLHIDPEGRLTLFNSNMSGAVVSEVFYDGTAVQSREIASWVWREDTPDYDLGEELAFHDPSDLAPLWEAK